jgi:hypothetical protein
MFLATLPDGDLVECAAQALDNGEWAEARDLLDRLCMRGVRRAGLPTVAQTPGGEMFAMRRPAYAQLLDDRIRQLNSGAVAGAAVSEARP